MSATVLKLNRPARLECSACGATAEAPCDCGAPYVPPGQRAFAAVAAAPQKSDRAVAQEIGVSKDTVRRARQALPTVACAPVAAQPAKVTANTTVRTGRDGKSRALPKRRVMPAAASVPIDKPSDPIQEPCLDCATREEQWQRSLSNLAGDVISIRAFWTRQFGEWEKFGVPSSLKTLVKDASRALSKLAGDLSKHGGT